MKSKQFNTVEGEENMLKEINRDESHSQMKNHLYCSINSLQKTQSINGLQKTQSLQMKPS
jgi:hypothetical protein